MSPFEFFCLRNTRRELVSNLTGEILEIGSGTGANFCHYSEPGSVTAIEPDPDMIRLSQELRPPGLNLETWSAESLPLENDSVEHIVSTFVLCSVDNLETTFKELKRVLLPGGTLHLMEHILGKGVPGELHELCTPIWSKICGGCHLNRATLEVAQEYGFQMTEHRVLFRFIGTPFVLARMNLK